MTLDAPPYRCKMDCITIPCIHMGARDFYSKGYKVNIYEFNQLYPAYAVDFTVPLKHQSRIFDDEALSSLPEELDPIGEYRPGRKGKINQNRAKTHAQCSVCHRILRNDFFYRNSKRPDYLSYCKECHLKRAAQRYVQNATHITSKRYLIFAYFASQCAYCGFNAHPSAIDMHHTKEKAHQIARLITAVNAASSGKLRDSSEKLVQEMSKCIPLCANCHRMHHAGAIDVSRIQPQKYNLEDFLRYYNEHISDTPQLAGFLY